MNKQNSLNNTNNSNSPFNMIKSPSKGGKTPPEGEGDSENIIPRHSISPHGRFKKSLSRVSVVDSLNDSNNFDACDKCGNNENITKALNHIRSYVDNINERINMTYYKILPVKKPYGGNSDIDFSLSSDYYHTIYYADLDKLKINSDLLNNFRSVMKSLKFFNDKFEYIIKKHEGFDKMANEYKNLKISNKIEDLSQLPDTDQQDIKNLEVQTIFKNFNLAKENFDSSLKELKNNFTQNNERCSNAVK